MNKNFIVIIFVLVFAIILGALAFVGWKYYQQTKEIEPELTAEQIDRIKYGAGTQFSTENPVYARALQYLAAGEYDLAVEQLKTLRSQYPKGTVERGIVDYSIGLFYAFAAEHQKEAIDAFKEVVTDPSSYNGTTRALAIEGIGRAYSTTFNQEVLEYIFTGPFLGGFLAGAKGDYALAMYNLATTGYQISKTPITSIRLAEKTSADLYTKRYTSEEEKNELIKKFSEYTAAGKSEVDKMSNFPGYSNYRSEFLSIYGGALQYMVLAQEGGYTSFDVETAYKEAYTLASDNAKAFIILRYGSFLSVVASDEKDTIEELSRRLGTIPQKDREAFDIYLRNIIMQGKKNEGGAFVMITAYRSKSPTFDAYVKQVLAR